MSKITLYTIIATGLLATAILQAGPILTINPAGGALTGGPNDTVGWGFTLTNNSDFLVVDEANYVTTSPIGVFSDFISGFFIVVGPSPETSSWSQSFDDAAQTGIGSYMISPSAALGSLSVGTIEVTYDLYSVSPNDPTWDPTTDYLGTNTLSQPASVLVAPSIPEPASGGMLLIGICAMLGLRVIRAAILGHGLSHGLGGPVLHNRDAANGHRHFRRGAGGARISSGRGCQRWIRQTFGCPLQTPTRPFARISQGWMGGVSRIGSPSLDPARRRQLPFTWLITKFL